MLDARAFLEAERRRIIKLFAIGLLITCVCLLLAFSGLLVLTANSALVALLGCAMCGCIGSSLTWALIARAPLWLAVLPICIGFSLTALGVGLLVSELRLIAIAVFLSILSVCSLSNNRPLALIVALVCGLLGIVVVVVPLPTDLAFSLGGARLTVSVIAVMSLMSAGALQADRFIASQNAALVIAEAALANAEAARIEAAVAHMEVERLQAAEQQRLIALVETLELPIIAVGAGMLVVPLVGELDGRRIISIQTRLLDEVSLQRASTVVLDLTGVSLIDTHVAQQLVLMAQAIRLLGARILLSGIRPDVAHTMVTLAIDLTGMQPVANLGAALQLNERAPDAAYLSNTTGRQN